MRVFVAVRLEVGAREALARGVLAAQRVAAPGVRWIAPDNWHFTLQFLGDTDEASVPPLRDALRRAAARHAPFEIVLAGVGAFPRPDHARVVWVGVSAGGVPLTALASDVARETAALGFAPEARAFQPHLTVARLKRPASVEHVLAALTFAPVPQPVREIVLYRSHLAPSGARYEALDRSALAG